MIEIKDLLKRWDGILLSEEGKKETVARVIGRAIGIELRAKNIQIRNGTVYLDIKPTYKSEVFLKQEKILSKIEEAFGKHAPKNIR